MIDPDTVNTMPSTLKDCSKPASDPAHDVCNQLNPAVSMPVSTRGVSFKVAGVGLPAAADQVTNGYRSSVFPELEALLEVNDTGSLWPRLDAASFGCKVERGACTAWVELIGELDLLAAPILQWHLWEAFAHARLVVLDLRQLSFMDVGGLHVISDASERADAEGRRLMVISGPERVHRVFTLTGLSEELHMVDVAERDGNLVPAQAQPGAHGAVARMQANVGAKVALTGPQRICHAMPRPAAGESAEPRRNLVRSLACRKSQQALTRRTQTERSTAVVRTTVMEKVGGRDQLTSQSGPALSR